MTDRVDSVVVGAGVVGLATARELALHGREVLVIDRHAHIGAETSSRNSEVIHAGLYYPTGSLKARLCVAGKQALYAYCRDRGVRHDRCGKLLVARQDAQVARLQSIAGQARSNGVEDLKWLDGAEVKAIEPAIRADAGLWSPSTGIVDSHELMQTLQGDIEAAGGGVALRSTLLACETHDAGLILRIDNDGEEVELATPLFVNAAGLSAGLVAQLAAPQYAESLPRVRYAKGHYFRYAGPDPIRHLLYPIPVDGGLGIHATIDLDGQLRFGPDVEWTEFLDYSVDVARAASFYESIRSYWPDIADGTLQPAYAGIRPKLTGPGETPADFFIDCHRPSEQTAQVHLLGIESPGLTASLAIGEYVRNLI